MMLKEKYYLTLKLQNNFILKLIELLFFNQRMMLWYFIPTTIKLVILL